MPFQYIKSARKSSTSKSKQIGTFDVNKDIYKNIKNILYFYTDYIYKRNAELLTHKAKKETRLAVIFSLQWM